MNATAEPVDLLDQLLGLTPGTPLHRVRHARDKVLAATQSSQEQIFDPHRNDNLTLNERLLVAYYASRLTPNSLLSEYYLEQLQALESDAGVVAALDSGRLDDLSERRLRAILHFTRVLIQAPVEGDKKALHALQQAGLSTPEIVTLAQLIAFLSYQVRLAAGLSALSAAGAAS